MITSRKIGGIRFTRIGRLQVSTCIIGGSRPAMPDPALTVALAMFGFALGAALAMITV